MKASIESRQKFLNERLDYYANFSASVANTIHSGWNFVRTTETLGERQVVVDTLGNKPWEICIVTATRDRLDFLKQAHTQLDKQHGDINWRWLIVDNSTNDLTSQFFDTLGVTGLDAIESKVLQSELLNLAQALNEDSLEEYLKDDPSYKYLLEGVVTRFLHPEVNKRVKQLKSFDPNRPIYSV